MKLRFAPLLICQLAALNSLAQTLTIHGASGYIAHAAVQTVSLDQALTEFHISNSNGQVTISQTPPYQVSISHLAYQTHVDTIRTYGQHQMQLLPKSQALEEVVITGQMMPQSVRQSVYNVRVLNADRLSSQGVQSLPEVLAFELNFGFQRDNAIGGSNASLQGISGQNIKVLLDGVPVVGRSGISNAIDLAQINLNSIEKIEIIEGPMAVNFGADALAGVINIITKKSTDAKWFADLTLQEETVGSEYQVWGEGLHNASLEGYYQLNDAWSAKSETRFHQFGGWSGTGRDKLWYPKKQFFQSNTVRLDKKNFNIYYRLDYLNETLENHGSPEIVNAIDDPYAFDKEYLTSRWMHQIQSEYDLKNGYLSSVVSYTAYDRITHRFKSYLVPGVSNETTESGQDSIAFRTYFMRNTLNDVIQWSLGPTDWHTQIGMDATIETANGTTLSSGDKQMNDLGFFISTEIQWGKRFKLRPGIRITHNNTFKTNPAASINMKYEISNQSQLRLSYGRGFRVPSLRELYHEFVDNNHNILGNDDLRPEHSNNINGSFSHQLKNTHWTLSLNGFYNTIENRITYFTTQQANAPTSYINLLRFKTWGTSSNVKFTQNQLRVNLGASYIGRYHNFSDEASNLDIPQFLYSPELIANLQYEFFTAGIQLASYYKFTGPTKQYQTVNLNDGTSNVELQQRDGFHFWDLTLSRDFFSSLSISLGAKNLLDVTAVNNNVSSGGAHSGTGGQSSIAYGRSFFIKLNCNFSKQSKQ